MIVKVQLEISARHAHLTETDARKFFNLDKLNFIKDLSVKGERATNQTIEFGGKRFRVLYPWRDTSYLEASAFEIHEFSKDACPPEAAPIPVVVNPPHLHLDRSRVPGRMIPNLKFKHAVLHVDGNYIRLQVKSNELDDTVVDDDIEGVVHLDVGWAHALGIKGGEKVYVNLEV